MTTTKQLVRQADGTLIQQDAPKAPAGGMEGAQSELAPPPAVPPVTPRGTAGAGGSPDSAKMSGTPAQKSNALAQQVAQGSELAQADRTQGVAQTGPEAATMAAQAKEAAGPLATLGSYGTRIQGLIQARLGQIQSQTAGLQVNDAQADQALAGKAPAEAAAAKAALKAYTQSGSEADLAKVRDAFGSQYLAGGGLQSLYTGTADQMAALAATSSQAGVTIGQLDLAKAGVDPAALAADLGKTPDQVAAMTPDQFRQAVQDTVNTKLTTTAALKAELASASPQRAKQIQDQLAQLGAAGESATEGSVAGLASQLHAGQTVQFNGQPTDITDLLKDDKISQIVRQAATDPVALQQLQANEPGLAAWVVQNQAHLADLAKSSTAQLGGLERTQADYAKATAGLTDDVRKAFGLPGSDTTLTADQAKTALDTLNANPVYQLSNTSPDVKAALQANPGLVDQLKGANPMQIQASVSLAKYLQATPDLAKALGVNASSGAVPVADLKALTQATQAWGALQDTTKASPGFQQLMSTGVLATNGKLDPAKLAWVKDNQDFLQGSDVQRLTANGTLASMSALKNVKAHPDVLKRVNDIDHDRANVDSWLASPNDPAVQQSMQQTVFGQPVDAATLDMMSGKIEDDIRNGSPQEQAAAKSLRTRLLSIYDTNADGQLTAEDLSSANVTARLRAMEASLPSKAASLAGTGTEQTAFDRSRDLATSPSLKSAILKAQIQTNANTDRDAAAKAASAQATQDAALAAANGAITADTQARINAMPEGPAKQSALDTFAQRAAKAGSTLVVGNPYMKSVAQGTLEQSTKGVGLGAEDLARKVGQKLGYLGVGK